MSYWKMDDFTKAELESVDQMEWEDELYILRHSPAARKIFAKAQYYMTLENDEQDATLFGFAMDMFDALDEVAREVAMRHPIPYHRLNPNRLWLPGVGKFMRLAEAIGFESKKNEFGETLIRTIDGWWMV